jgi:YD repeat-containing protein
MSSHALLFCLITVSFLAPLLCRFASGQVGMYIYRNKKVKGYETYDEQGRLTGGMLIQRDNHGNMISRISLDASDGVLKRFEYENDPSGLMVKKTRFDRDNQRSWYAVYTYDAAGRRVEQRNFDDGDSPTSRVTFYYDAQGERIRNEVFDAENRPVKVHIYLYDALHRRIRDLTVDLTGEVLSGTQYVYDESGFVSRIEYFDDKGSLRGYHEVACDSDGNRLMKKDYDTEGNIRSTTKYTY